MGEYSAKFDRIDGLLHELNSYRPLTEGELRRLRDEFLIGFTYNSNAIEGNTLTLQETALVLNEGVTIDGKPLKDHLEVVGHKEGYLYVEELVKQKVPLSEKVIKDIHSLVLMDRRQDRGVYRRVPVTIMGSSHMPPQPYLVPSLMEQLIVNYEQRAFKHVVERVASFHLEFETIHPFIDGNGRTGRLLLNLKLMKGGYPPINIKYADRKRYYDCFTSRNLSICKLIPLRKRGEIMRQCSTGTFPYTIQPGDTLWSLAQRYNTTVDAIVAASSAIAPDSLSVGQVICIPGPSQHLLHPGASIQSPCPEGVSKAEVDLKSNMRMLWEQHVAWTRMTIISIAANLADEELVTKRLLRNPSDFEALLRPLYGDEKAAQSARLFTDHLVIAAQLVKAAKAGDSKAAAEAEQRWYANADEIAAFLNRINPFLSEEAFRTMLHEHLALTKSEAVARLNQDYASDIAFYDQIEKQALMMADAMTEGIVQQFPDIFKR